MKSSLFRTAALSHLLVWLLAGASASAQNAAPSWTPDEAKKILLEKATRIESQTIKHLPVQHRGRLKPLDSLARETLLFISGKRSWWGLDSIQTYVGLIVSDSGPSVALLEVRSPDVRKQLGLPQDRRHFSLLEIRQSPLEQLARPLIQKEQANSRLLTPGDREVLEVVHQQMELDGLTSGQSFFEAADYSFVNSSHGAGSSQSPSLQAVREYLSAAAQGAVSEQNKTGEALIQTVRSQQLPPALARYSDKIEWEVFYNSARLFVWVAALYLLVALGLFFKDLRKRLPTSLLWTGLGLGLFLHAAGFGIRVYITGFSPVTNMYGTMLWVSFGVSLFSALLYQRYRNDIHTGLLLAGSSMVLWLTESLPLTLSPDMDPIVAVLRNNFWLSTHVLTITLSYAAFTVAMLMGNAALVLTLMSRDRASTLKSLAHSAYRMIQLGVFLLTTGIILGGVWADYSWGRFWGWDPKETWALIADLGFLVILHARYTGWLRDFGTLAASTVSYLLVIMAWYGVNFILATGLHSYGFSSGGTLLVGIYVALQLGLLSVTLMKKSRTLTAR